VHGYFLSPTDINTVTEQHSTLNSAKNAKFRMGQLSNFREISDDLASSGTDSKWDVYCADSGPRVLEKPALPWYNFISHQPNLSIRHFNNLRSIHGSSLVRSQGRFRALIEPRVLRKSGQSPRGAEWPPKRSILPS
jgi:hypothetical protein